MTGRLGKVVVVGEGRVVATGEDTSPSPGGAGEGKGNSPRKKGTFVIFPRRYRLALKRACEQHHRSIRGELMAALDQHFARHGIPMDAALEEEGDEEADEG